MHENQYYLGRIVIWAKREDDVDMIDMSEEEREEFFEIGKKVKKVLKTLFQPDRMNYANLQNIANHLHVHIIPRYRAVRFYQGMSFVDENFGKNYAPYKNNYVIPEEVIFKIKDAIKERLEKDQQ